MSDIPFESLQRKLQELYASDNYQEAYKLAQEHKDDYPDNRHLLYYWCSTMAARIGDNNSAILYLRQMIESGFWYGEVLLRKSPSYKDLQGDPEFEHLVTLNRELQEIEQEKSLHLLTIRPEDQCEEEENTCPMLIGLHANSGNAQTSLGFWHPAAAHGWLVVVPQSSQSIWKGAYVWDNQETSAWEIERYYRQVQEQYAVNLDRVILAGHSMGGEIAAWLSISGKIPAMGFIAFGPGGPFIDNLDNWKPIIEQSSGLNLRGYIIVGERDHTIPQENIFELVEILTNNDINCKLEVVPGAAHDFVMEYEDSLLRGIEFITS